MFRHNTGVDLSEFPALGAVPTVSRGNAASSIPPMQSGRLGSYATTTSMNSNGNHFQDNFTGNGAAAMPNLALHNSNSLPSYHTTPSVAQNGYSQLAARGYVPKAFSVDEFPALRNPAESFGQNSPMNKSEPWLSYGHVREDVSSSNEKYGSRINSIGSSQWLRERNGAEASLQQLRLNLDRKPMADSATNGSKDGIATSGATIAAGTDEASDSYGLLGLLGVIRMTNPDRSMLALGSDLTTLGLDLNTAESTVQASPAAHQRMRTFSEEILFYAFYCMPRDIAQDAAAQELYNRNWRYHKELGLWLTKNPAENNNRATPVFRRTSQNGIEQGVYVFFDPATWQKVKREWTFSWDSIEDLSTSSSQSSQQQTTNMTGSVTPTGIASRGLAI
ncbi:hypothetical protein EC973_007064 [Apophysomyces ossiformis]|uniref:NOT2/NOT3/NOT5 C-terminal domain-containing protein n=1 Tax=Apophysomyces ossiformis TaxID=679940 RepID=A0A8H7EUF6_9FUNG|nr:hypothetical protein EC973_007064 [Apophysomyces ossiformis]